MKRMVTLYCDENCGELARVAWGDAFANESEMLRLDVLNDAVAVFSRTYESVREEVYPEDKRCE